MISVIIPAYNAGAYIDECLDSIRHQTFEDFEVIVIDDGSADDTAQRARVFAAEDPRFSVLEQENQYAGIARNKGMWKARGDYLLFFDADDRMLPSMLEQMAAKATSTNADIVVCCAKSFRDGTNEVVQAKITPKYVEFDQVYSSDELGDNIFRCVVGWPWDKLFKAEFIRNHNLEFQGLPATNDAYFVFSAMALAERIVFLDSILAEHRKRQGSIETARSDAPENTLSAFDAIRAKLAEEDRLETFNRALVNWGIAHLRWDFRTMPEDSGQKAFEAYLELLLSATEKDMEYPMEEPDRWVRKAFALKDSTSFEYALAIEAITAYKWSHSANAKEARIQRLLSRVKQQEKERSELEKKCEELEKKNRAALEEQEKLRGSSSSKIGNVLTAFPRKFKK